MLLNLLQSNFILHSANLTAKWSWFQFYTLNMGYLKANKHQVCCLLWILGLYRLKNALEWPQMWMFYVEICPGLISVVFMWNIGLKPLKVLNLLYLHRSHGKPGQGGDGQEDHGEVWGVVNRDNGSQVRILSSEYWHLNYAAAGMMTLNKIDGIAAHCEHRSLASRICNFFTRRPLNF